jgi:hypothetical protein
MTTQTDDVRDRVGGYIKHNAAKSPAGIHDLVVAGNARLDALLDGISDGQASFKPAADVWSVLEVLAHVVTGKRQVAAVCGRLARGEQIAGAGSDGEGQDGVTRVTFSSLAEARAANEEAQSQILAAIDSLSGSSNASITYHHFVFGDLNCFEWAVFQRVHDGDHANQVEQVIAAPGYPKA